MRYQLLVAVFLIALSLWRTEGFCPQRIKCPKVEQIAFNCSSIQDILSQPFYYLSRGKQTFVFQSLDGKYVLKFFDKSYLKEPWYLWSKSERAKRALRTYFYQNSYSLAFERLKEEILHVHQGNGGKHPEVLLIGPYFFKHRLDLNHYPFVLQRKGELFCAKVKELMAKGKKEEVYRLIDRYFEKIEQRIAKLLVDRENHLENNWGIIDGRVFQLDPGRLFLQKDLIKPDQKKKEWNRSMRTLEKWLDDNSPDALSYFKMKKEKYAAIY